MCRVVGGLAGRLDDWLAGRRDRTLVARTRSCPGTRHPASASLQRQSEDSRIDARERAEPAWHHVMIVCISSNR